MRISQLDIPADLAASEGLRPILLTRLGSVVTLVGPNGAGKSRLLKLVASLGPSHLSSVQEQGLQQDLEIKQRQLVGLRVGEAMAEPERARLLAVADDVRAGEVMLARSRAIRIADVDVGPVNPIVGVPREADIGDTRASYGSERDLHVEGLVRHGLGHSRLGVVSYLDSLAEHWFNATHPKVQATEEARRDAVERFDAMNGIMRDLLGTELGRDLGGETVLFGRPLLGAELSDGQRQLLQMAVALHARADAYKQSIVFLDEPEKHVHPAALLDVVDRILKVVTGGQVWIATHSLSLLARLPPESFFSVYEGQVTHVGSTPEVVLKGLVGDDTRIQELAQFLASPAAFAATRFAEQCLAAPAVAQHRDGDPQTRQISGRLETLRSARGGRLRVLDYGAGRGRLLEEMAGAHGDALKDRFDYRAFEPDQDCRTGLKALASSIYADQTERTFADHDALHRLGAESVDVAVMCNVLHEVDPTKWVRELGPEGPLARVLARDGFLLIVEDQRMPVGEMAHRLGFIVLHEAAVRALFGIRESDPFVCDYADPASERLSAFLVPADALLRVTRETRTAALKVVRDSAQSRIREQRAKGSKEGRRHALDLQLFANASLALEE